MNLGSPLHLHSWGQRCYLQSFQAEGEEVAILNCNLSSLLSEYELYTRTIYIRSLPKLHVTPSPPGFSFYFALLLPSWGGLYRKPPCLCKCHVTLLIQKVFCIPFSYRHKLWYSVYKLPFLETPSILLVLFRVPYMNSPIQKHISSQCPCLSPKCHY